MKTFATIKTQPEKNLFENHIIELECNGSCDKILLKRWLTTLASILLSSDVEICNTLEQRRFLKFIVKSKNTISYQINTSFSCTDGVCNICEIYDVDIPVIIGTQLSAMCEQLNPGDVIDYVSYIEYRKSCKITLACPTCSFNDSKLVGCFIQNQKYLRLPVFAFVDPKKLHYNNRTKNLCLYKSNKSIAIPNCLQKMESIIKSWADKLSNYSLFVPSLVFMRLIEDAANVIEEHLTHYSFTVENNIINVNCTKKQLQLKSLHKKLLKKSNELNVNIISGNVTYAISKNTHFRITEMGGQSNETDMNGIHYRDVSLAKSENESRRGYHRSSSRYLNTTPNHPAILLYAPLHCTKLLSGLITSNACQSFDSTWLTYFCVQHTVDNKNAGLHLELIPGVQLVNRFQTVCEPIKALLDAAEKLTRKYPFIQREICNCANVIKLNHSNTFVVDIVSEFAKLFTIKNCTCNFESKTITLVDENMQEVVVDAAKVPRLDIVAFAAIYAQNMIVPLDVYFNRQLRVGIVRSVANCLIEERYYFTPSTREWLLVEYNQTWNNLLSPAVEGNISVLGTLASFVHLPGHSSTAKTTSGLCGLRHACGLITNSVETRQSLKSLCYAQNDLSRFNSVAIPCQSAFVIVTTLGGDNIEDGIVVSKQARDRGFGMTQAQWTISMRATSVSENVSISFPSSSGFFTNNVNLRETNDQAIIPLENYYLRRRVKEGSTLFDIHGIGKISTFAICVQIKTFQSSTRVIYADPYRCGNEKSLQIYKVTVEKNTKKSKQPVKENSFAKSKKVEAVGAEYVINIYFREIRLLECGDKFSTCEGQKATVISVANTEDLPFYGGRVDGLPPQADVYCNISMEKRQTLGLTISANVRALKCAEPSHTNLNILTGDKSLYRHDVQRALKGKWTEADDPVAEMLHNARYLQQRKIYDGRTGLFLGLGDIFVVPFLRYEQEGSKAAHFVADSEDILRNVHDGTPLRGRGQLGGMKQSQSDTWNIIASGGCPTFLKQLQTQSESRLAIDDATNCVPPATIELFNTLKILGFDVEIEK